MIQIKIYSNKFTPLVTLFDGDFDSLKYKTTVNRVGTCSFVLDLSNEKVTNTNIQHYNRVEIIDDGVLKFIGIISLKEVRLDTAEVRCVGLIAVLDKRILNGTYLVSGQIDDVIPTLIDAVNADGDTGIIVGAITLTSGVNKEFESATAYNIVETIVNAVEGQFEIDAERKLNIRGSIGEDLSETVLFQYDIEKPEGANIQAFSVSDDGEEIVTTAYGKSDTYSSTKEDALLTAKYGKLERFKNFRVANTQQDLDEITEVEVRDKVFSPDISLSPEVPDNFKVGDTVRVILKNNLITIDDSFQILEKTVNYIGKQKQITVRISDLSISFLEKISDINKRVNLLEQKL